MLTKIEFIICLLILGFTIAFINQLGFFLTVVLIYGVFGFITIKSNKYF